jgi:hypothetical protein
LNDPGADGLELDSESLEVRPIPGLAWTAVECVAVVTITIHVLEIVGAVVLVLLYLLVKVWRRI